MIFLGPLFIKTEEQVIREKSRNKAVQNQANAFQWNCIDGFIANGKRVQVFNVLPVGTFPNAYNQLYLPTKRWEYNGVVNTQVGCINLPIIKQIHRTIGFSKALRNTKDNTIIIYSTYLPALLAIKKLNTEKKVVLIVTDLPEFYDNTSTKSAVSRLLRKVNNNMLYKCIKRVNGFVLLTEEMKIPLHVGNRPYTIVEGICDESRIIKQPKREGYIKNILYTGTLNVKFGIERLVEAFLETNNPNYRLQVCGGGEYEKQLIEFQKKDSRIQFYGFVTREQAIDLQQNATVLVNPRTNDGEYTKYSFPSKTMEYLQSGVPTVAYKLDGIPNEYDPFINIVPNNSIGALKAIIEDICDDDTGKYIEKAEKARMFVNNEKNRIKQAKKIMDLISEL